MALRLSEAEAAALLAGKPLPKPLRPRAEAVDFAALCKYAGLPVPVPEHLFAPGRRLRFDYAWTDHKVALEVEGVVYPDKGEYRAGGRHASVRGFKQDIEKYLLAATLGWSVVRCLPKHLKDGTALKVMEAVLR